MTADCSQKFELSVLSPVFPVPGFLRFPAVTLSVFLVAFADTDTRLARISVAALFRKIEIER